MKKLIYSLFLLAMTAMTFTGCEDVPAPYTMPTDSDSTHETPINPSGTGTQDDPFNVAAALNYITAGQGLDQTVYVKGVITGTPNIELSYGNATYNISDDKKISDKLEVYHGFYFKGAPFTAQDQIKEGDTLVVSGKLTNYKGTNEFTTGNSIYSINGKTGTSSDKPSGDGTENSPYNVAKTKSIFDSGTLPTDNVYIQGIVAKTGTVDSKYGSMTYYISDDGQSANDLEIYHGMYLKGDKFTSNDQLAVGDTVVILGQLSLYTGTQGTSQEIKNSQIISIIVHKNSGGETGGNTITEAATDMGFTDKGAAGTATLSDGTTLTFAKGEGATAPAYYAGSYAAVRMYAKNTLVITATGKKIVKISITTNDPDTKKYNGNDEAYAMSGDTKVAINNKASNTQAVFDGLSASTITIVNAFTGTGGGVQLRIKSITITYAN
ncbi:MAG: hypothetical protein LKK21_08440 [Prevotella sp.]|jgi:hypothetical protein|nr:hypothetical protein [Prevotella sp.]MCI2088168.1 hypothetical protein [Prevotella sp.]MCI2125657.1 hypothetical protein [Prevotella sp.]